MGLLEVCHRPLQEPSEVTTDAKALCQVNRIATVVNADGSYRDSVIR